MTAGQFSEVDLDRLADFVGGALDGTPDEAEVRRLVEEDPAWAAAYADLAPAVAAVRDQLADWGVRPEELPPMVADRLDTALAAAGTGTPVPRPRETAGPHAPIRRSDRAHPTPDRPTPDRPTPDRPTPDRPTPARPASRPTADRPIRRRRLSKTARPVLLAVLVVAVIGGGAGLLGRFGTLSALDDSSDNAATSADSGAGEVLRAPSAVPPRVSGTDYDVDTLPLAATMTGPAKDAPAPASTPGMPGIGPETAPDEGAVPPVELARLTDAVTLGACLDAVAAEHSARPVTVELVDLAAYRGRPAVVTVFTDGAGARWVWVSGPSCGLPGSGADTRDSRRVG
ncbi:hypothetical protein [Plantactinospora sp. GCM10030261]|uniref:hypothetical protein n=1 Tax=Plantactinospora sp. GCM10030261 TaxID=3273420 RepID=UPI0036192816